MSHSIIQMGQSDSQMCPPLHSSEQVNAELERRFVVCPHPLYTRFSEFKLLHQRLTNRKFALRVITADEHEKRNLEDRVLRRKAMTKSTLTHLQHYIFERYEAYCSQQFRVHLLFALDAPVTLREEILKQGKGRANFTEEQLISGLEDLVGGLLWVRFLKEKHGNISTHHIYCREGKMQLADPFLCPQGLEFPEKYPSPEKLQQMANKIDDHNSYEADLFSIAMCILEAIPNVHLQAAYKRNYTINQKVLREEMQKCSYPRLKNILENLLLGPDNLQNRRRYLQLYTSSKSQKLGPDSSSSRSLRPIKIHTLGNRMNGSRQSRNSAENSDPQQRMRNRGFGQDQPEIDTQFLQNVSDFPSKMLHDNYEHKPYLQLNNPQRMLPSQQPPRQIMFNYGGITQQSGLSYLKRVQSIPTIDSTTHIPHHLYQFNNGPFIIPKQKVETFPSQVVSRSSSDYSVKSQLVVYEPSKSSFNFDLISPRQPNDQPFKEKEYHEEEDNLPTIKINRCLDFSVNNSFTKPEEPKYPTHHFINFAEAKPVLSYGVSENDGSSCQESFVISSRQIQTGRKEEASSNNMQSLPMKLSYLVKDKVIETNNEQPREFVHTSPPSQLKNPQKMAYNPNILNHTIPEEQPQEEESFDAGERQQKGEYRIQLYQNGSKYEGFIYNNMREGYGTFYYKDGGYYQGEWKQNLMNGNGRLYYDNDHLAYEGQWYNDQFHGKGKVFNDSIEPLDGLIDYSNFQTSQAYWTQYIGELSHDIKQGFGKWIFSNGEYYQGEFKDDLPSGKGSFHSFNKKVRGVWNEGKLQSIL